MPSLPAKSGTSVLSTQFQPKLIEEQMVLPSVRVREELEITGFKQAKTVTYVATSNVSFQYVYLGKKVRYVFPPLGTLSVNPEDVEGLRVIETRGGGCCGAGDVGGQKYFTIREA